MWNLLTGHNPTSFRSSTVDLKGLSQGSHFFHSGKNWLVRLVKLSTALTNDAIAAGEVLCWKDPENYIVTNDVSDSFNATTPYAAGIALGAASESGATTSTDSWVFILTRGIYTAVKTDGGDDIVECDLLMASASVDGGADRLLINTTSIADPADTPASADALRDDLVTNTLANIRSVLNRMMLSCIGFALDDDVDASNTVSVFVDIKL